ncbi:beta-lactamase family protein [Fibrella sp. HMF5335]|uniref:Beta-lactamase family protein n=1 Tax=Fibrella rubiginis TaxID=2817060 RepID=A0A939K1J1_9BACT|nr:serine hydrolase domain-containing protein [Fibrella rubiginis]MBO0935304.1 beta-lactamase family protein [Fibrella rubiginis]
MHKTLCLCLLSSSLLAQPGPSPATSGKPQQFYSTSSVAKQGFSAQRLQRLDSLLQGFVDKGIAPNAVALVARNGVIVHHKAYGYSNVAKRIPSRTTDIYRIASQSKAITTATLLTLLEEQKFLLDDPIAKYIPAFKSPTVLVSYDKNDPAKGSYETRPAKTGITIRELLAHNAGIPYEHPLDQRPEFKVPFFASLEADRLEDVVNKLAKRPLLKDPGDGFVYGLNTDIIGRLVEILSGDPLDVAMRKRVLEPLGMKDTHFYLPANKAARLVELYSKEADGPLTVHTNDVYRKFAVSGGKTYFSGGAGLVSTVEDYAKFCQMLLNGGEFNGRHILGRKTVEMMVRNQIGEGTVWDRQDKFGLGLQLITANSHYGDQASPGSYTWGGMYCSEYTVDPTENVIMLVFTNVHPYAHYSEFVRKFRMAVYQAME